ncbi:MAG TPA: hypothetical protein VMI10_21600 [Terriglobales bacterium]|nr:hypothetical protein [Terriglobales bacterium]
MKPLKSIAAVMLFIGLMVASAAAQRATKLLLHRGLASGVSQSETGVHAPAGLGSNPFVLIDYPGAIANQVPYAMNDKGRVVGYAEFPDGSIKGYLLQGTTFKDIVFPGAPATGATGISPSGTIVGVYCDDPACDSTVHGFQLKGKNYTALDDPDGTNTSPSGVNAAGDIVGSYTGPDNIGHGFLLHKGVYTSFDAPGAGYLTSATSINKQGQIAGFFYAPDSDHVHGFLLQNGVFTQIDYPGASGTILNAINDSGEIVGIYGDAQGGNHGFLLSGGVFTGFDAPFPGTDFTSACGLNNHHQIVGVYGQGAYDFGYLTTY